MLQSRAAYLSPTAVIRFVSIVYRTPFPLAPFTQDAEHLTTGVPKYWYPLWSTGVFTQLTNNICVQICFRVLCEWGFKYTTHGWAVRPQAWSVPRLRGELNSKVSSQTGTLFESSNQGKTLIQKKAEQFLSFEIDI